MSIEEYAICAAVLAAVGLILCIPKKTVPIGVGCIAAGATYGFFALVELLLQGG